MDAQQRTRRVNREKSGVATQLPRGVKQIVIPMTREAYDNMGDNPLEVRRHLDELLAEFPELFPAGFADG